MAATTISRTNIGTNDDGSGTTGTVINTSYIGLAIYDAIDALFSSTTGIRLNQAGGDAAIISLESSDVAHGMTSAVGTDTYGDVRKVSGTDGGLLLRGFTEVTNAVGIQAWYTSDNSTRSTAGTAPISLAALLKSGTSAGDPAANANLVIIQSNGTTRFIFDSDGDAHADVSWTTFDTHNDLELLASLEGELAGKDALREGFHDWMTYNRDALAASQLVTFNDDGHHFVNFTRLSMALCGAVRQLGAQNAQLAGRLLAIEGR
jgi:hypothetical protein